MKRLCLIAAVGALLLLPACGGQAEGETPLSVYYAASQLNGAGALDTRIWEGEEADVESLFAAMKETGLDGQTDSALPAGTELRSYAVEEGILTLDLTADYGNLSGIHQTIANYCIVLTMTQLDGVEGVRITVEGEQVTRSEVLYPSDVMLDGGEGDTGLLEVELCFPLADGSGVGRESAILTVPENRSREETLLQQLCSGPESRELTAYLPSSIGGVTLWVEEDVCYINLNEDWISQLETGEIPLEVALGCIVDTMCQLDGVEAVQFLMDGAALEQWADVGADFPMGPDSEIDNFASQ